MTSAAVTSFQHSLHEDVIGARSKAEWNNGYKSAMLYGPSNYPKGIVSSYLLLGYEQGCRDLYALLPYEVHIQLQMLHMAFASYGRANYQMTFVTPALSSSARRAVHILLRAGESQKLVKVSTLDSKKSKLRKMRFAVTSSSTAAAV